MSIPKINKGFTHPHAYEWHDGHTVHYMDIAKADQPVNEQAAPVGVKTYGQFAQHYGTVNPGEQTNLKFYPLEGKNQAITDQVGKHGYQTYYAGGKYGKPDLANKNYNTKHIMVYDPSPEQGASFEDEKYTDSWRKVHELAHALTYPELNQEYGEGRRLGKLGVRTPREAERAVKWEWLAAHKQRDLLGQLGVHVSDEDFHRELNTVMHDALHRAVTGQFTEPSHEGFQPHSHKVPLETALNMVREHATGMGLSHPDATLKGMKKSEEKAMKIPSVKYNIEKACWEGYEMVGMKEKKGKQVPNCVPKKKSEPDVGEMMAKAEALLNQVRLMKEESSEYAGHMAKANLYKIAKSAQELYELFEDDENVEPWVEEKIAICANNIDTVADYMQYERMRQGRAEDEVGLGEGEEKVDEYPQSDEEMTKSEPVNKGDVIDLKSRQKVEPARSNEPEFKFKPEKHLPPLARHGIEVEEALTFDNEPKRWFVKRNGYQHGGDIDSSGSGDLTFGSQLEAYKYAKSLLPKGEMAKAEGDKKYSKKVKNKETGREKTVRYGAKGYTIAPGTSRGDSYCARSYGQMKDHPAAAKDPNSPLRLSRKKWKCSGKTSRKSEGEMDKAERPGIFGALDRSDDWE